MSERETVKKKTSIGGQALIEGIMMRGPDVSSMAVRHTSGEIVLETWDTDGRNRSEFWKFPLVRGVYAFIDSMAVGYKCLTRSAELSGLEDDEEEKPQKAETESEPDAAGQIPKEPVETAAAVPHEDKPAEKEDGWFEKFGMTFITTLSVILGVVIAIGLFMMLPIYLYSLIVKAAPSFDNQVLRAVMEGLMRIILFVGYITVISLMKDIRRVFMYHGAEHKTIFCYEKGEELTVENVRHQRRFHPRCGTSFIVLMLLIGIIVSAFISSESLLLRTGLKLLVFPIVVGIGYELIKLAGRSDALIVRIISAPGLWLQRVTTKEPTDDMIEVAIKAFKAVIPKDPDADRL